MINKLKNFLKNKGLMQDAFNVLLGVLMLVALAAFIMTKHPISIYLIIIIGALMNLTTGLKFYQQKKQKNLGMSMMLMSGIILFLLVYVLIQ